MLFASWRACQSGSPEEFDRQMGAFLARPKDFAVRGDHLLRRDPEYKGSRAVLQSRSGHYIALLLNRADAVMPRRFTTFLDPYLNKLERSWAAGKRLDRRPARCGPRVAGERQNDLAISQRAWPKPTRTRARSDEVSEWIRLDQSTHKAQMPRKLGP